MILIKHFLFLFLFYTKSIQLNSQVIQVEVIICHEQMQATLFVISEASKSNKQQAGEKKSDK